MAKPARQTSISEPSPSGSSSSLPPPPSSASKGKRKRERESLGGDHHHTSHHKHSHNHHGLGALEDQEEEVDETDRLDEETRAKLVIVLKAMDPTPSVLTLPLPATSTPNRPHRTLLDLISANPIPTPAIVHAFLDTLSPPSTSLPATTFSGDTSSKVLTREQEVQRFSESVRNVVDGLGRGRRGKGVDYEPPRKVALYQKLPSFGVPPNIGGGGTYFTSAIETEDDLLDAGNAELIEIHDSETLYSRSLESEPRLGQNSKARPRRAFHQRQAGRMDPHVKPVEFLTPPSLFSSFAPSYDSSSSTISVYQSAQLLQSQQVLEYGRDSLVESLSSANKKRRVEDQQNESASLVDVEDLLEKNWTWVRRLEELQRLRVLEGEVKPSDEENELASSLQSSLITLVSLRPTILTSSASTSTSLPALLPSLRTLLSLHAFVAQSNPSPAYQGSLEPTKPYALKDNATLKLHQRPSPSAVAPAFQQQRAAPQAPQQPIFGVSANGRSKSAATTTTGAAKSAGGSGTASPRQFVPTSRPSTLGWATGGGSVAGAGAIGGNGVAPVGVLQWAKTTPGAPGVGR